MVINRLHPAGEGDLLCRSANFQFWEHPCGLAEDPDKEETPHDHIQRMVELCTEMVPGVKHIAQHAPGVPLDR
jgi:hypothetical protein